MHTANIPINPCELACFYSMFAVSPSVARYIYSIWLIAFPTTLQESWLRLSIKYIRISYIATDVEDQLDVSVFSLVCLRIRETGRVQRRTRDVGKPRVGAVNGEKVNLRHFNGDPIISTDMIADKLGMLQRKVLLSPVQLNEEGLRRLAYCRLLHNANMKDLIILRQIL